MLVEEALQKLDHQIMCCGGLASGHPEGVLLRVIVGAHRGPAPRLLLPPSRTHSRADMHSS